MATKDGDGLLGLIHAHKDEADDGHERLRRDLTKGFDQLDEHLQRIEERLGKLERNMDRLFSERRQQRTLSAQRAVLIGSIAPSIVAGLVALIMHFWKP